MAKIKNIGSSKYWRKTGSLIVEGKKVEILWKFGVLFFCFLKLNLYYMTKQSHS